VRPTAGKGLIAMCSIWKCILPAAVLVALIWDGVDDPAIQWSMQFEPFADGPVPTEPTFWGSVKTMFR
jgi:hypothetical protein